MGLQKTLRALADPIRREILNMLKSGRMSAGEITERFDVTAAAISRHLSVLREADLIRDTREGKFIFYELNASVLEEIMLWISDLKGENGDDKKESYDYLFALGKYVKDAYESGMPYENFLENDIVKEYIVGWKSQKFYDYALKLSDGDMIFHTS
mgnify:CR=1 FL=1